MNKYLQAQSWCLENNIKVYIVPIKHKKKCYVEIDNNGQITRSPNIYDNQSIASSKIWDLYLYLFKQKSKHGRKN
jgi:hypothetical protein